MRTTLPGAESSPRRNGLPERLHPEPRPASATPVAESEKRQHACDIRKHCRRPVIGYPIKSELLACITPSFLT